ncbi:antibiotic biosynthesis monooxygenase family protein [Thioalkalivibrio nitratireducens]|nr:antibiotic biosynthesis monooxygenase family protein [Thioalkalivibrio nitratireducens]
MSRFRVIAGQEGMVREAFRQRPRLVDAHPGFIRLEVLTPDQRTNEFWLITFWRDRESFERWHADHLRESHAWMPRGLKLEPGSRSLTYMELVAE